jgi:hypothetical protein
MSSRFWTAVLAASLSPRAFGPGVCCRLWGKCMLNDGDCDLYLDLACCLCLRLARVAFAPLSVCSRVLLCLPLLSVPVSMCCSSAIKSQARLRYVSGGAASLLAVALVVFLASGPVDSSAAGITKHAGMDAISLAVTRAIALEETPVTQQLVCVCMCIRACVRVRVFCRDYVCLRVPCVLDLHLLLHLHITILTNARTHLCVNTLHEPCSHQRHHITATTTNTTNRKR